MRRNRDCWLVTDKNLRHFARVEELCGRFCFLGRKEVSQQKRMQRGQGRNEEGFLAALGMTGRAASVGEGEDEEVAFAGDHDGEGATVGGNGEFAEGKAVKNGDGCGLQDGDFFVGSDGGKRRNGKPNNVAGFFLKSALEEDA